jgi:CcmD family protein
MSSDGFWYLFAGYGAFWLLLAGFLIRLGRRHRELERELQSLEGRLGTRPSP